MRYVVIGNYREIEAFRRERRLALRDVIPVLAGERVLRALLGLDPEEVMIVLVHGSECSMNAQAFAHIERFRALGAQFLVMD